MYPVYSASGCLHDIFSNPERVVLPDEKLVTSQKRFRISVFLRYESDISVVFAFGTGNISGYWKYSLLLLKFINSWNFFTSPLLPIYRFIHRVLFIITPTITYLFPSTSYDSGKPKNDPNRLLTPTHFSRVSNLFLLPLQPTAFSTDSSHSCPLPQRISSHTNSTCSTTPMNTPWEISTLRHARRTSMLLPPSLSSSIHAFRVRYLHQAKPCSGYSTTHGGYWTQATCEKPDVL